MMGPHVMAGITHDDHTAGLPYDMVEHLRSASGIGGFNPPHAEEDGGAAEGAGAAGAGVGGTGGGGAGALGLEDVGLVYSPEDADEMVSLQVGWRGGGGRAAVPASEGVECLYTGAVKRPSDGTIFHTQMATGSPSLTKPSIFAYACTFPPEATRLMGSCCLVPLSRPAGTAACSCGTSPTCYTCLRWRTAATPWTPPSAWAGAATTARDTGRRRARAVRAVQSTTARCPPSTAMGTTAGMTGASVSPTSAPQGPRTGGQPSHTSEDDAARC